MELKPILSVAVPAYNVERYLDKCLTSFSDERLNDILEVMIVNDGSLDRTQEIAERYVARFPRIFRLINKENGGHGSAVNTGIEHANGKYFRIVDGDDWVHTENLIRLLEIMRDADTDMIVDEKREVHMVTGDTEFFPLPKEIEKSKALQFDRICMAYDIDTYIMLHTLSVKTELLRSSGVRLLEHIFYVDIEYIIKVTMEAKTITFYDLEIYQYLVGNVNQSVSAQNYVKRYSHHDQVTKELIRYAGCSKTEGVLRSYLDLRVRRLINTHMNISLLYNTNRKEGLQQAQTFRAYLKKQSKDYYHATKKRYVQALILHMLGVDYERLQRIMR